jgi:hypothetical protein
MGATETGACLNCGAPLTGTYCSSCGQKRPHTELSLRELLHEATEELIHWEGKVPSTLKALFLRPGLLTRDFLAGRRARWLSPLRVYLISSLAFFVSGPLVEGITHRSAREVAKVTITNPNGTGLTPEIRQEIKESLPARIFGAERIERAATNSAALNRTIESAYPKAMFILLPFFALLTSIAWRKKLPQYPAHLYFALHLHAVVFGVMAMGTVLVGFFAPNRFGVAIGLAALGYVAWYTLAALRRVFGDTWVNTVGKAVAIGVVYTFAMFAVSLGLLGYAIATM